MCNNSKSSQSADRSRAYHAGSNGEPLRSWCNNNGLSVSMAYEAISAGLLVVRYIGTKPYVPAGEGIRFFERLPTEPMSKPERLKAWGLSGKEEVVINE